ncbi:hypothetical protein M8818_001827 [Zalaria obscura]|uniref:Uncharacterized protein n=1 Tax=Zalaria obscura TaxID=2024903 RepID=A0ACC3SK24_9PEZI
MAVYSADYHKTKGNWTYIKRHGHTMDTSQKPCYLTKLPGELRNLIYSYVFQSTTVALRPRSPLDKPHPLRPLTVQRRVVRQHHGILGKQRAPANGNISWETSLTGIILTCHQIHDEALPYLYAKTTFFFEDLKRLRAFLAVVPQSHTNLIRRLELYTIIYGTSEIRSYRYFQNMHHVKWTAMARTITQRMPYLESLQWTLYHPEVMDMTLPIPSNAGHGAMTPSWACDIDVPFKILRSLSHLHRIGISVRLRTHGGHGQLLSCVAHPVWQNSPRVWMHAIDRNAPEQQRHKVWRAHMEHMRRVPQTLEAVLRALVLRRGEFEAMKEYRKALLAWFTFRAEPVLNS